MIELTDQERRALQMFTGANWLHFVEVARDYLSEDEIEDLALKLQEEE